MRAHKNDGHSIYHGDALDVLANEIEDNSVDLAFADPPYNIGKRFGDFHDKWPSDKAYAEWCEKWLLLLIKKLKPSGSLYVMTSTQAMPYLDIFLRDKIEIMSRIVWSYDSSGVQAKRYYGSMYEPLIFGVKNPKQYTFNSDDIAVEAKTGAKRKLIDYRKPVPAPYNSKKVPGNVWDFARVRYRMEEYEEHPSQKPEALLERIILASSNKGDIILDPFAGTFTASAVAKRLGRRSIGIEREQAYIDIGLRRVLGLSEFEGRALYPPKKNNSRKNANGVKGGSSKDIKPENNQDLFHVVYKA
ncbi:adenine-specific DNA-methyltransferase [Thalassospira sp. TSL5-1]|uniref:adenine-specific DNA-methyltransferase n=1 Tax=Thalassospira sp. TSL5-1 TaxID=1544451 RepID=UPI00093DA0E5|nr:adenine-specific DNA-methyltransferase [Thalassospira sp. TSL5-1]